MVTRQPQQQLGLSSSTLYHNTSESGSDIMTNIITNIAR